MNRIYLHPVKMEPDGSFLLHEGDRIVHVEWHYPSDDDKPKATWAWVIDASVSDG